MLHALLACPGFRGLNSAHPCKNSRWCHKGNCLPDAGEERSRPALVIARNVKTMQTAAPPRGMFLSNCQKQAFFGFLG